jgi:hypothetical protein
MTTSAPNSAADFIGHTPMMQQYGQRNDLAP